MLAYGLTLAVLATWFVQGIGFVQWLAPSTRAPTLLGWVLAMWLGLALQVVVLVNLYFLVPGLTVHQIAWPAMLLLSASSLVLYTRTPRAPIVFDRESRIVVPLVLFATLLVLRPLIAHGSLGFYSSNNGEFLNYAAMTDVVLHHDASIDTHGMVVVSREGVAAAVAGVIASITGRAALWVIQPVAAAFAALAFASLGLLFRTITSRLSTLASVPIWLVYAWAILSASSQCFFTLSFVSQYLNMGLFFGGLVFLAHTRDLVAWRRLLALGVVFAALACAYPEMLVPTAGLLCAYELAASGPGLPARGRAVLHLLAAVALGALLANRLAFELVVSRGGGAGGWDIYGPHHPLLPFVARVLGFTSTFAEPHTSSTLWPVLAALLFAAAIVHAIVRIRRESDAATRGLYHVGWMFYAGVAGVFWLVAHRHLGTNYVALKFLLGFDWLAYLLVALAFARLLAWQPRAILPLCAVVVVVLVGLARPALEFTKQLHRAEKTALFVDDDAQRCRATLRGRRAHVSTDPALYIIGRFIASDHDLLAVDGRWPDGTNAQWTPGAPIVLVGEGRTLAQDAAVTQPYHPVCTGRGFTVLEAD